MNEWVNYELAHRKPLVTSRQPGLHLAVDTGTMGEFYRMHFLSSCSHGYRGGCVLVARRRLSGGAAAMFDPSRRPADRPCGCCSAGRFGNF